MLKNGETNFVKRTIIIWSSPYSLANLPSYILIQTNKNSSQRSIFANEIIKTNTKWIYLTFYLFIKWLKGANWATVWFVWIILYHNKFPKLHGSDPLNNCEFIKVVGQFLGKVYLPHGF